MGDLNGPMSHEERQDLVERVVRLLCEPMELPDGCPSLGDRVVGAIETLYRERADARSGEYEAVALLRAWSPVIRAALAQAEKAKAMRAELARDTTNGPPPTGVPFVRWENQCRATERLAEALTADERQAAEL